VSIGPTPRKVVLDVDPGIDSAVALALTLFDPSLEVVAVTASAGNVSADHATRAVQAIIEQLDPPRWPRIGAALEPDSAPAETLDYLSGADGLGNSDFRVAELHQRHPADKVLFDTVRTAPQQVTVVTLGPATNVARCLRRDPAFASQVGQLIIGGGTYQGPGDVSPAAEFNFFFDPQAAREVLRSRATKQLVPLDVAHKPTFDFSLLDRLPAEETRVGGFLRRVLPFYFRSHRQHLGLEGIRLPDVVAVMALTHPELFTTQPSAVDVEVSGEITSGATVFDRRSPARWSPNVYVALEVNAAGVLDALLSGLEHAAAAE
jgi:purine nucleosidase